ncbi:hypothetical protein PtB15_15B268 [Puccinia triticina]|nr:hypothetical protein PtB15_15B268 [Puccinia triticina]
MITASEKWPERRACDSWLFRKHPDQKVAEKLAQPTVHTAIPLGPPPAPPAWNHTIKSTPDLQKSYIAVRLEDRATRASQFTCEIGSQ